MITRYALHPKQNERELGNHPNFTHSNGMKENQMTAQFLVQPWTKWKKIWQPPDSHFTPTQSGRKSISHPIFISPTNRVKENLAIAQFSFPPLTKANYKLD